MQQAIGHQMRDLHEAMQTLLCGQEFVLLAGGKTTERAEAGVAAEGVQILLSSSSAHKPRSTSGAKQIRTRPRGPFLQKLIFANMICKFLLKRYLIEGIM